MARSFLGGEFAGGESAWWRGDWIPYPESPRVSSLIVNALLKCQRFCNRVYTPCSIVPHIICMDIL